MCFPTLYYKESIQTSLLSIQIDKYEKRLLNLTLSFIPIQINFYMLHRMLCISNSKRVLRSACRSLVEIDFLMLIQLFLSLTEQKQNKQKIEGKPLKIMQNMQ